MRSRYRRTGPLTKYNRQQTELKGRKLQRYEKEEVGEWEEIGRGGQVTSSGCGADPWCWFRNDHPITCPNDVAGRPSGKKKMNNASESRKVRMKKRRRKESTEEGVSI